jgi:hypothetical protein
VKKKSQYGGMEIHSGDGARGDAWQSGETGLEEGEESPGRIKTRFTLIRFTDVLKKPIFELILPGCSSPVLSRLSLLC